MKMLNWLRSTDSARVEARLLTEHINNYESIVKILDGTIQHQVPRSLGDTECPLTAAALAGKTETVISILSGSLYTPVEAAAAYEILEVAVNWRLLRSNDMTGRFPKGDRLTEYKEVMSTYTAKFFRKAQKIRDTTGFTRNVNETYRHLELFQSEADIERLEEQARRGDFNDLLGQYFSILQIYRLEIDDRLEHTFWPCAFADTTEEYFRIFFNYFDPVNARCRIDAFQHCIFEKQYFKKRVDEMDWRQLVLYYHIMALVGNHEAADLSVIEDHPALSELPPMAVSVIAYYVLQTCVSRIKTVDNRRRAMKIDDVVIFASSRGGSVHVTSKECNDFVFNLTEQMELFRSPEHKEFYWRFRYMKPFWYEQQSTLILLQELPAIGGFMKIQKPTWVSTIKCSENCRHSHSCRLRRTRLRYDFDPVSLRLIGHMLLTYMDDKRDRLAYMWWNFADRFSFNNY